jgi:hypothetical protein
MIRLTPGLIFVITALFFIWNLYYGALIQTAYPESLVSLYIHPIWRALLVIFLLVAASMSKEIGLMVALAVFFYFMDIPHFIKPWSKTG